MAIQRYSKIRSYESALEWLGTRQERIVDFGNRNVRVVIDCHAKKAHITLHGNIIVTFEKGKETIYPYIGQFKNSQTTKRILRAFQN